MIPMASSATKLTDRVSSMAMATPTQVGSRITCNPRHGKPIAVPFDIDGATVLVTFRINTTRDVDALKGWLPSGRRRDCASGDKRDDGPRESA